MCDIRLQRDKSTWLVLSLLILEVYFPDISLFLTLANTNNGGFPLWHSCSNFNKWFGHFFFLPLNKTLVTTQSDFRPTVNEPRGVTLPVVFI